MKKLLIAIAVICGVGFAIAATPSKKAGMCIAITPTGVCLQPTEAGTNYCIRHRVPLTCKCGVTILSGGMEVSCGKPCAIGKGTCLAHANPD